MSGRPVVSPHTPCGWPDYLGRSRYLTAPNLCRSVPGMVGPTTGTDRTEAIDRSNQPKWDQPGRVGKPRLR
jgi:hypothetical protein